MQLRDRCLAPLERARKFTEGLLTAFQTPADWTQQIFPGANHALWLVGHLALVDNFAFEKLEPSLIQAPAGYDAKFGMGSAPVAAADAYPPVDEVLAFFRERREKLVAHLATMSNSQLASKLPGTGLPPMVTDFASVFDFITWHEGVHAGQLSMCRRALGHAPLMG